MTIDWEAFSNKTETTAEVRLLGLVDVPSLLALQKLMVHDVRLQSRVNAAVLLCEHPPAITMGSQANLLQLPADRRELEARLITVHPVKRDGLAILHQPGQLVVSVVVSLPECSMDEQEFREQLLESVIRTCHEQQVQARRRPGDSAVVEGRHGVVAELGIRVDEGVTSFGVYLNVSNRLDEQRQIGRGLLGERISSLNAERVRPTQMSQVRSAMIRHVCEALGYPEYHIYTGHPFLKRTRVQVDDKFTNY